LLEPVFHEQVEVVALVQDLATNVRVERHQPPHLAVLLGDELLVERRDLYVEVKSGQVEIGRETLRRISLAIPLDVERRGLVVPIDLVEVEQLRELTLAVVSELDALVRKF
jgi:hypothetical protein